MTAAWNLPRTGPGAAGSVAPGGRAPASGAAAASTGTTVSEITDQMELARHGAHLLGSAHQNRSHHRRPALLRICRSHE